MCKLCGVYNDEHPPGCCNFANIVRMAFGGEFLPMHPTNMGVRPILSKPVDFVHLKPIDTQKAKSLSKSIDEKLERYREEK